MEFRILGPVELWSGGRQHDIKRAKERCLLAILLQDPGRPVSVDRLIGYLWDGQRPAAARDSLYSYVSRLRNQLNGLNDGASIATFRPGGYALQADKATVDLHQFKTLRRQARAIAESGDDERALDLHRMASALFRGDPLADLTGHWVEATRAAIQDELLVTTLERIEVEIRLGHHADLVAELSDLVKRQPLNEKLVGHLMLALYRGGRYAEALKVYHDLSHRLHGHGTEPAKELKELHGRIVRGDRALLPVPRVQAARIAPINTLPDDLRLFTGRDEEISELLEMVSSTRPGLRASPTVIAIDGMGGVGKTVLAVHLAHRLAGEYPDGQLYLDLHGYDADHPATDPGTALDALLRMLDIQAGRIPQSIDDRAALWRSELASRRVLIVLDNAIGRDQVRHLLSGAPGCLTLIASRRRLVGLDDVRSHSLGLLSPPDAARLLELVIGPDRSPNADDLAEVVRLCDFLPLAIRLVGNRLRHHPAWTVASLARRLAARNRRLAEIRAEGREITAVFDLSYRDLDPRAQQAFRRLGLHLGRDFTLHSAAAMIGSGLADADRVVEDLLDNHLLSEPTEGRYLFHNLIRDYARQLAENEDSDTERRHTVQRQLDHHVSMALLADRLLYPHGRRVESGLAYPPPDPAPIVTLDQAGEWMAAEYQNLLIVADYAATRDSLTHIGLFAHALARYLEREGHWDKATTLHERAVVAWRELGDAPGEAQALLDLSLVRFRMGQYVEALDNARQSLKLYRSLSDAGGMADVLDHRGLVEWQQSRYRDALASSREALAIRRSLGDQRGQAMVLDHIAIFLEFVGRYEEAASRRGTALKMFAEIGEPSGAQMLLNNQGDLMLRRGQISAAEKYYEQAASIAPEMALQHEMIWQSNMSRIALATDRYTEAVDGLRRALTTCRQIGDRRNEIEILIEIGVAHFRLGKHGEAIAHYEQALILSRGISEVFEQAKALNRIGEVLLSDDRLGDAEEALREGLGLARAIGEPSEEARALVCMGTLYLRTRGRHPARKCWRQALRFYERAGMSAEAESVRVLLAGLSSGGGT